MFTQKKNFKQGTLVVASNTGSDIDGVVGRITGKSMEHVIDFYIVTYAAPISETYNYTSVTIPETQLTEVDVSGSSTDGK